MAPGRYHRPDNPGLGESGWQALYLALAPETCIGEILRNTPPDLMRNLNSYRLSEIEVLLVAVIDCRAVTSFGISMDNLTGDHNYETTQRIAQSAVQTSSEAILVPSATRLGDNLVIFPDNLKPGSRIEVVASRDPALYVERD